MSYTNDSFKVGNIMKLKMIKQLNFIMEDDSTVTHNVGDIIDGYEDCGYYWLTSIGKLYKDEAEIIQE
jgi:hypothetical protein